MKISILDMQNIARDRGGRCLSKKYLGSRTKLTWECEVGHQWDAVPGSIKLGHWCPICGGAQKGTIEELRRIAERKGGSCLSEEYINNYSKLRWQCKEGHQWDAVPSSITRGFWCRICAANVLRVAIEEMQQIAEAHEGQCLSREYINNHSKLVWQCKERHLWEMTPSHIKRGIWCPVCTGRHNGTLEEMHKIAEGRGGKCLSRKYINSQTKLTWKCEKGHQWKAIPRHIKHGSWCPLCARNNRRKSVS